MYTCCRLRLACRAEPSFSSCFTLILMISWRNFSFASFESNPPSIARRMVSSSDSSAGVTTSDPAPPTAPVPVAGPSREADVTVETGPWVLGELRSLAELEEVKDGEEREEREDVTERRREKGRNKREREREK